MTTSAERTSIRRLSEADADAYVSLRKTMLVDSPLAFGASPEDDFGSDPSAVREQLRRGSDWAIFGAFDGEHLVGSAGMFRAQQRKASHKAHIWGMFVLASHRGRGVGRGLLAAAIAHARSLTGVTRVDLSVSSGAATARRLYERTGFVSWGVEPDALRANGRSVSEEHMVLPIGEATADDRAAVIEATQRMFTAMREKDEAAMRAVIHPDAAFVSSRTAQREIVRRSGEEFIAAILSNPARLDERITEPRVNVDGRMAMLHAQYDFHIDQRFSHRGSDVFVFVSHGEGWKLIAATYTIE